MVDPITLTFVVGLATNLASSLIASSAGRVARRFGGKEAVKALEAALREALEAALQVQKLDPGKSAHYEKLFRAFLERETVLDELSKLIDPNLAEPLNLATLERELIAAAAKTPRLLEGFDARGFLAAFAGAFYSAAGRQPALQGVLEIKLLGQLVLGQARLEDLAARGGKSLERAANATEQIAALGEKDSKALAAIHGVLTQIEAGQQGAFLTIAREGRAQGFLAAFEMLQLLIGELNRAGYAIEVSRLGTLELPELPGDKVLPAGPREEILEAASELRQAITGSTPTTAELDKLESHYRQHLVDWFKNLEFRGLQAGTPISLPLEEVYVELRAVAEVPEAADSFSVDERRLLLEIEEGDEEKRRELTRQLDGLRKERWSRGLPERQSIAEALHHRERRTFVILGDPGSGKTTLLHFLALVYARGADRAAEKLGLDPAEADRLPIFAPLAAFDDMLREAKESGERRLPLWEFLPAYYDRRRNLPGLAPLFRRALESGKALVLLDGLDEVIDVGTRGYVAEQVAVLAGEWAPRGVRFALSSRFVGYREAAVPGSPTTLSVLDFGLPEIRVFLHRWAQVYERTVAGGESSETLRKAQEQERGLLADVESNDSVRRLAANPLMLTMLALLRRQVGKLPHKRVMLYEAYLSTLLDSWIAARSLGARDHSLEVMDRNQAENLLMPLALWLHTEKPNGTAGRFEMREELVAICLEEEGLPRERAATPEWKKARKVGEGRADRFLKEMREMTGLLVERGHDAYGFLHLTFQEYFAGRELARKDDKARWDALRPHLHDPRWREPILLCAGRLGIVESRKPQVSKLVRNILDCEDPTEGDLHRNLLLALAIAGDDVGIDKEVLEDLVSRAVGLVPTMKVYALAKNLLEGLGRLVANGQVDLERVVGGALGAGDRQKAAMAVEVLSQLGHLAGVRQRLLRLREKRFFWVGDPVAIALKSLVTEHADVRNVLLAEADSVETLEILAPRVATDSEVFQVMVERLGHQNEYVRVAAVRALGKLAEARSDVRALLEVKLNDPSTEVAQAVRSVLVRLEKTIAHAQPAKNFTHHKPHIIVATLLAFRRWICSDPTVLETVITREYRPKIGTALEALTALSTLPNTADETLQSALLDYGSPDGEINPTAARTVAQCITASPELKQLIFKSLRASADTVRGEALFGLVQAFPEDLEVAETVRELAGRRSWKSREIVAQILGDREGASNPLLPVLQVRQGALEFVATFSQAFSSPGSLGIGSARIYRKLLDNEHWEFRAAALRGLSPLAAHHSELREQLLSKLADPVEAVREVAVATLIPLAGEHSEVKEAILNRLSDLGEYKIMSYTKILTIEVAKDPQVREATIRQLADSVGILRQMLVKALGPLAISHSAIRQVLLGQLADSDTSVRQATVEVLSPLVVEQPEIREAVLRLLTDPAAIVRQRSVKALGPLAVSHLVIQQALLDQLADSDTSVRKTAVEMLSPLVAEHPEIRGAILRQLADPVGIVRLMSVKALRPLVVSYPAIRQAILGLLADCDNNVRQASLKALGLLASDDPEVREAVFAKLTDLAGNVRQEAWGVLLDLIPKTPCLATIAAEWFHRGESFTIRLAGLNCLLTLRDQALLSEEVWCGMEIWLGLDLAYHDHHEDAKLSRRRLATAIAQDLPSDPVLHQRIRQLLRSSRASERLGGILTLTAWPGGPPEGVIDDILESLKDERDLASYPARLTATSYLINDDRYVDYSIDLCLEALEYGTQAWERLGNSSAVRQQAALVLGKLEPVHFHERAFSKLLEVAKEDKNPKVRDAAYNALVRLARTGEEAGTFPLKPAAESGVAVGAAG